MGYGNIVMFALCPLLGKVCGESWVPMANILSGIKDGISQIFGSALFHMRIATGQGTELCVS